MSSTQKCTRCKCLKDINQFGQKLNGVYKKGCIACLAKETQKRAKHREKNKEYARKYNKANQAKRNIQAKQYRADNIEQCLSRDRAYHHANKEVRNENSRAYHHANKDVCNENSRAYRTANKDACNETARKYYYANTEVCNTKSRAYYHANKDACNENSRKHYQKHKNDPIFKAKRNEQMRKYRENPVVRIKDSLRARVYATIKHGYKSARTMELLGCTIEFFHDHIAKQFTQGMSFENYGKGWELDHIRPCASFNLLDPAEQRICFHWSNYQPLWALDNNKKGSTWQAQEDFNIVMSELLTR